MFDRLRRAITVGLKEALKAFVWHALDTLLYNREHPEDGDRKK